MPRRLAGGALAGPVGAFLALPTAALISSFISNYAGVVFDVVLTEPPQQPATLVETGDADAYVGASTQGIVRGTEALDVVVIPLRSPTVSPHSRHPPNRRSVPCSRSSSAPSSITGCGPPRTRRPSASRRRGQPRRWRPADSGIARQPPTTTLLREGQRRDAQRGSRITGTDRRLKRFRPLESGRGCTTSTLSARRGCLTRGATLREHSPGFGTKPTSNRPPCR